jgi:hypothetical protein
MSAVRRETSTWLAPRFRTRKLKYWTSSARLLVSHSTTVLSSIPTRAIAEVIREEDVYSGIRVTVSGALARAAIHLHVDVNVGDPIWPKPQSVGPPRLLDGVLQVRGYPLVMVLAETPAAP